MTWLLLILCVSVVHLAYGTVEHVTLLEAYPSAKSLFVKIQLAPNTSFFQVVVRKSDSQETVIDQQHPARECQSAACLLEFPRDALPAASLAVFVHTWGSGDRQPALGWTGPALTALRAPLALSDAVIPSGSEWEYWDQGPPVAGWHASAVKKEGWKSGRAPLQSAHGGGTRLAGGSTAYYFRRSLVLPSVPRQFELAVSGGDGAVVYVNGEEVYRSNLPAEVHHDTPALVRMSDEAKASFRPVQLLVAKSSWVVGNNLVCVEVHRASGAPEGSFDLRLAPVIPAAAAAAGAATPAVWSAPPTAPPASIPFAHAPGSHPIRPILQQLSVSSFDAPGVPAVPPPPRAHLHPIPRVAAPVHMSPSWTRSEQVYLVAVPSAAPGVDVRVADHSGRPQGAIHVPLASPGTVWGVAGNSTMACLLVHYTSTRQVHIHCKDSRSTSTTASTTCITCRADAELPTGPVPHGRLVVVPNARGPAWDPTLEVLHPVHTAGGEGSSLGRTGVSLSPQGVIHTSLVEGCRGVRQVAAAFNPSRGSTTVACSSTCAGLAGIVVAPSRLIQRSQQNNCTSGFFVTALGSLVPLWDGRVLTAWAAPPASSSAKYPHHTDGQQPSISLVEPLNLQAVQESAVLAPAQGRDVTAPRLAQLTNHRFLAGWSVRVKDHRMRAQDATVTHDVWRWRMAIVDESGSILSGPEDVTDHVMWSDDTDWVVLNDGSIAWAAAWRAYTSKGDADMHVPGQPIPVAVSPVQSVHVVSLAAGLLK